MAFLPFTLIFLFSLLHFQENMAKPYIGRALDVWPKNCLGQYYCTERPQDYPEERLRKLYSKLTMNVELPMPDDIETEQRLGSQLCRIYENSDPVYMIIDENDEARFTVQIPGIHEVNVTLRTCHEDHMLEDMANKIQCQQAYTTLPYLVLSQDWTRIEVARVKKGLPTNCAPIFMDSI